MRWKERRKETNDSWKLDRLHGRERYYNELHSLRALLQWKILYSRFQTIRERMVMIMRMRRRKKKRGKGMGHCCAPCGSRR